jgi:hypothetical protein
MASFEPDKRLQILGLERDGRRNRHPLAAVTLWARLGRIPPARDSGLSFRLESRESPAQLNRLRETAETMQIKQVGERGE